MKGISYKLSKRVGKNGKSEVSIRIHSRGFDTSLSVNVFIDPKYFEITGKAGNNVTGFIKIPKQGKLNFAEVSEVTEAKRTIEEAANKLLRICEVTPAERICKEYLCNTLRLFNGKSIQEITAYSIEAAEERAQREAERASRKGFFDYADCYLQENNFADSRTHSFHVLMRTLHRWQEYRNEVESGFVLDMESLNADDVQSFREYLRNEYDLQSECPELFTRLFAEYPPEITPKHQKAKVEERGENTVIKYLKFFKTYWYWLRNQKHVTKNDPFVGVQIGSAVYGVPYYLTIEERNKLADFDLSSRPALEIQRDIFVFQCLIGCRVGDLYKMTASNITNGILEYIPAKTKDNTEQVKPRIPLNDRAKALISKYQGKDKKGRIFPFISTQKYNEAIKDALRLSGIDRNVPVRNSLTGANEMKPLYEVASSHMARRTFVGTAYSKVKDPNIIGKMSGHVEGSRAFTRYRAIDDDILKDVINMIE